MRRLLLFVGLLLGTPTVIAAQGASKCGTLSEPQDYLRSLSRYFVADSYARVRANKINQVPPGAPQAVVSDDRTCNRLMHPVMRELRSRTDWQEVRRLGYEHRVFQFGDYYAVLVVENDPPGSTRLGWSQMFVFRASDLAMVAKILV